jgi:phenylalanyl-tRNA synthetase beta chain
VETPTDGWDRDRAARRFDLAIEEDLIEEIARIHGYDAIPTTLPAGASARGFAEARIPDPGRGRSCARRKLVARDYLEAINYAFVDAATAGDVARMADGGVAAGQPAERRTGRHAHDACCPGWCRPLASATPRASSRAFALVRDRQSVRRPVQRGAA